jgi:hypothetical protein
MNKKQYNKPEVFVETLLPAEMIATSNIPYGGYTDDTEPNEATRHRSSRGQWGNLWYENED